MSEYWKSTPSYWCKFCSQYVRDTGLERRNHESSQRHQNNIQRSLRELHKGQEREGRDKQRAKDEVARLNGLVNGKGAAAAAAPTTTAPNATSNAGPKAAASAKPAVHTAAQRRAQAEQLAAMGIELPDELKAEVSGVGGWKVVSEKAVDEGGDGGEGGWSLAGIKREAREEEENAIAKGVHKRKAEDEEDLREGEGEGGAKRKLWGSKIKTYPGAKLEEDVGDLDALLSGVGKAKEGEVKKEGEVREEAAEDVEGVKHEQGEETPSIAAIPAASLSSNDNANDAPPAVVFKKRKGKK